MAVADTLLATAIHGGTDARPHRALGPYSAVHRLADEALGPDAYPRVRAKALPLMPQLERMSRTLFDNLVEGKALRKAA